MNPSSTWTACSHRHGTTYLKRRFLFWKEERFRCQGCGRSINMELKRLLDDALGELPKEPEA